MTIPAQIQTKFGTKVHLEKVNDNRAWNQSGWTICHILIQRGDKVLPYGRKVTCKKCLRIINQEEA